MIFPIRAEDFVTVMSAVAVAGTPQYSSVISLAAPVSNDAIGHPCIQCELWINVASNGTTDDLLLEIFPCADGDTANRGSAAKDSQILGVKSLTPFIDYWMIPWDVGFGHFQVRASRTGSTDTLTTTIKARRYRLADGRGS